MPIEEKIIYTLILAIFAIAVQFTSHPKRDANDSFMVGLSLQVQWLHFFFNKDSTEKRYTKLFFTLFFLVWIPIVWIFG
jgi:hypothetical protein